MIKTQNPPQSLSSPDPSPPTAVKLSLPAGTLPPSPAERPPVPEAPPEPQELPEQKEPPAPRVNRLPDYLAQLEEYWFRGPKRRFAKDAGVSEATFSRIFHGVTNPRYKDVCKIVALLEKKLGKRIDPRDIYEL